MTAYVVRNNRSSPVMDALRALEAQQGKQASKSQEKRIDAQVPATPAPAPAKRAAKKKPAVKKRKAAKK